jgi:hypothetical protein
MARHHLLKEAFDRLNQQLDSFDDALFKHATGGLDVLGSELAQAHAMLDILATRLSAIPASSRAEFEPQLAPLRRRWGEAQEAYQNAKESGGDSRRQFQQDSRAALDEVQDGLLQMITQMNQRFAGHPPPP